MAVPGPSQAAAPEHQRRFPAFTSAGEKERKDKVSEGWQFPSSLLGSFKCWLMNSFSAGGTGQRGSHRSARRAGHTSQERRAGVTPRRQGMRPTRCLISSGLPQRVTHEGSWGVRILVGVPHCTTPASVGTGSGQNALVTCSALRPKPHFCALPSPHLLGHPTQSIQTGTGRSSLLGVPLPRLP